MQNINLSFTDKEGNKRSYAYPWDDPKLREIFKWSKGNTRLSITGLPSNEPFNITTSEIVGIIPSINRMIRDMLVGYKVVFADNEIEAVKLMFNNDLDKAYGDVFTSQELSEEENSELRPLVDWADIIDTMKSHDHFMSYGFNFYADIGSQVNRRGMG